MYNHLKDYLKSLDELGNDPDVERELRELLDRHDRDESLVFDVRVRQATQEDIDKCFGEDTPQADVDDGACAVENLGELVAVANEFGTIYAVEPQTGRWCEALEKIVITVSDTLAIQLPTRHRPEEAPRGSAGCTCGTPPFAPPEPSDDCPYHATS